MKLSRMKFSMTLLVGSLVCAIAQADDIVDANKMINMEVVKQIESGGNPLATNSKSGCRGLYQLSPYALADYNTAHEHDFLWDDMYDAQANELVAEWYIAVQLPRYLRAKGYEVTTDAVLICFHDGFGLYDKYRQGKRRLGPQMRAYLVRYRELTK